MELTDEYLSRLNGWVERIIQKAETAEMLRRLSCELKTWSSRAGRRRG
jgi:hypothetical protein